MKLYLIFLIGVFVGSIVSNIAFNFRAGRGVLSIDHHWEKDMIRFELDDFPSDRTRKIIIKVDHNATLSQD